MGRRTLLLITALVVAALGTTMVFLYVNGVNDRALAGQKPVRVLVAKSTINAGTSVADAQAQAAFVPKEISSSSVARGALSDLKPIENKVALSTIFPGEQILLEKFGDAGSTTSLQIPTGKLAITVTMDDPSRVAGYVSAGSKVAVFLSIDINGKPTTKLLLPQVTVIGANGQTLSPTTSGSAGTPTDVPKALVTLAVDQSEYQKVLYASSHGKMSLALLGKNAQLNPAAPGTSIDNLFPQS
ncbi:MAG: Flp pilus assembly protein CpaB [Actinomycetes bacterium]